MVELLMIGGGYLASAVFTYGFSKNLRIELCKRRGWEYDRSDEDLCILTGIISPIALISVSLVYATEMVTPGLTFRTSKQKALPNDIRNFSASIWGRGYVNETALIRQTGQERMMEKIRKAEERRKEEKMEQNRQLFLAWERETREKLDREIAEAREAYASLVPRLSQELLHLKPKDLVTADEEEYQYLDAQIKRKIGLGHGLACLSYRFWTNVFGRIKRDEDSVERKYGVFIAECVVAFYSASISSLCALVPCLFLGGIGVPIGCITTIASILAVAHTGKNFKDCHKCRYLQKSGFLARHNVRKGLAKSDLALPSLRS